MATALITGASAGLGAEFARQLAADGWDLVLVARGREGLDAAAADARSRGVAAEVMVADLGVRRDTALVAARLAETDRPIDLVVNNAGFGTGTWFLESTLGQQDAALEVMVRSLMALSHSAAVGMVERGRGAILNVSSIAALIPGGPYSAHKAWVESFTRGLALDLRGSGVTATILRPGLVRTEFQARAGMDFSSLPSVVWLDPTAVVRSALKATHRGKRVVTPSIRYRLLAVALRLVPGRILARSARSRRGAKRRVPR